MCHYAENFYSAYAQMLMAYKWSNPRQLKYLQKIFSESEEPLHQKALSDFQALSDDQLPQQLVPEHKVSQYVNGDFGKNRFNLRFNP